MLKPIIRLLAFFSKEFNEIVRQPRLVLSLIFGPFLILLLFGIGYQGAQPLLRTILVVPPDQVKNQRVQDLAKIVGTNFQLVAISSDQEDAMRKLQSGQVDLLQVLPTDWEQRVLQGQQAPLTFRYNEIDPSNEKWVQYLGYVEVSEINRLILTDAARQMQAQAGDTKQQLAEVRTDLDALQSGAAAADQAQKQQSLQKLDQALGALAANPLLASQAGIDPQTAQTRNDLQQLRGDLQAINQSMSNGTLAQQQDRIRAARDRTVALESAVDRLSKLPPEVLAAPVGQQYQNVSKSLDLMTFYAPGVIALMLQHIAVTLGALSLVREKLQGALEMFGVSPVSMLQVLFGKYLAYTLFLGVIAAALVLLMLVLNIPFLGSLALFVGLMTLFLLASLGIGFLISTWSHSDSQAVQLSMLVLLLSVFFSGFFLPLSTFRVPARYVGYILPITHGMPALQDIMLKGAGPTPFEWIALAVITAVTFVAVALIWGRQFRTLS